MSAPDPIPFTPEWPEPDRRYLHAKLPPPPPLPLEDVVSAGWITWVRAAAEAKAAPIDYVFLAALAACAALIGNTRWPSPWTGWSEPPILWAVAIGSPSMNKSPGLDAVLNPLKQAERKLREKAQVALADWRAKAEVAKLVESTWKEAARDNIKSNKEPPARPAAANPGPEPRMPRLATSDVTVEKLADIVSGQPRGGFVTRDELAGWLQGMYRYSSGGSDRPFWLEAYGGRAYSVERMGRAPVYIDRLSVGVLGGIQPDRLRSLVMNSDDDGLLARFMPVWPEPAPLKRPSVAYDEAFIDAAFAKLLTLEMPVDDEGQIRPWIVPFAEDARELLDDFRRQVRDWEAGAEGLLLSFIGKLPGLAVRLSLVLGMMDWASGEADGVLTITCEHFGRAAHLVESYFLPMARRTYADAVGSKGELAARRLVVTIREAELTQFTVREIIRMNRAGLVDKQVIKAGLAALEEDDIVRAVTLPPGPRGGRPTQVFLVNPAILAHVE